MKAFASLKARLNRKSSRATSKSTAHQRELQPSHVVSSATGLNEEGHNSDAEAQSRDAEEQRCDAEEQGGDEAEQRWDEEGWEDGGDNGSKHSDDEAETERQASVDLDIGSDADSQALDSGAARATDAAATLLSEMSRTTVLRVSGSQSDVATSRGQEMTETANIPLTSTAKIQLPLEHPSPATESSIGLAEWGKKLGEFNGIRYRELRADVRFQMPIQATLAQRELAEHMRKLHPTQPMEREETLTRRLQKLAQSVDSAAKSYPIEGTLKQPERGQTSATEQGVKMLNGSNVKKKSWGTARSSGSRSASQRSMDSIMTMPISVGDSTPLAWAMSPTSLPTPPSPSFFPPGSSRARRTSDMDCDWVTFESQVDKGKETMPASQKHECCFDTRVGKESRSIKSKPITGIAPRAPYGDPSTRPATCASPTERDAHMQTSQVARGGYTYSAPASTAYKGAAAKREIRAPEADHRSFDPYAGQRAPEAERHAEQVPKGFYSGFQPPSPAQSQAAQYHIRVDALGLPSTLMPTVPVGGLITHPSSAPQAVASNSRDHRMALQRPTKTPEHAAMQDAAMQNEHPMPWEGTGQVVARRSVNSGGSEYDVEWVTVERDGALRCDDPPPIDPREEACTVRMDTGAVKLGKERAHPPQVPSAGPSTAGHPTPNHFVYQLRSRD
eukprot:GEMP01013501.1.p1 GENE.GEMP01013501.1~~GEMP01013501.1.p1  ORF type:complete len:673 (+),score=202.91 GEMP01013501.1:103-2121(+)